METIQEAVRTPEGAFAVFIFLLGGCLFGGIIIVALSSSDFCNFFSDMFLGGVKCKSCKRRSKQWTHWPDIEGETTYTGWEWCPFCGTKRYEGFEDRAF